jgi:ABC-type transport system involved in multi-copper enzyme maturation permease subunit
MQKENLMGGWTRTFTIALSTYRESIRSKILYSILVFAVLVVGASALFGSVTIGDQVKVIKDFGLFALSLFTVLYCIISGSSLLYKELERRTIFNLLSKPVRRWEFLTGKFLGIFATAAVLLLFMGIAFTGFVAIFEGTGSLMLFLAYYHLLLELLIVCASVIFFSSVVVTPLLIGIFSFGLFLAGRSTALLLYFIEKEIVTGLGAYLVKALYWLLPHLNIININDALVYNLEISLLQTVWATIYAVTYSAALLLLGQAIFQRREFN